MIKLIFTNHISFILLLSSSLASAQNTLSSPTTTDGFNSDGNKLDHQHESWLKRHDRLIFILLLSFLLLIVFLWYIIRSIRSMRQRLNEENQQNMMMFQHSEMVENVSADGFHKLPLYAPSQQQYNHRYQPSIFNKKKKSFCSKIMKFSFVFLLLPDIPCKAIISIF